MKLHALPLLAIIMLAILTGCASSGKQAPVVDRAPAGKVAQTKPAKPAGEKDWRPESYTVKKGDTLHSIGLEFGFDYKEIAQWNNIQSPYVIHIGRQLKLKEPKTAPVTAVATEMTEAVVTPLKTETAASAKPLGEGLTTKIEPKTIIDGVPLYNEPKAIKEAYSEQAMKAPPVIPKAAENPADSLKTEAVKTEPAKTEPQASAPGADDEAVDWSWPVNGKLLTGFNDAASAKGLDIAGSQGQAVLAAAPGKVVYCGSSLRGYGKLIIIKHNKTYLSAYAHNSQLLVKEGQEIIRGQKIAEMGSSDTDRIKLHFEIRKLGKPVDPAKYLPANSGT